MFRKITIGLFLLCLFNLPVPLTATAQDDTDRPACEKEIVEEYFGEVTEMILAQGEGLSAVFGSDGDELGDLYTASVEDYRALEDGEAELPECLLKINNAILAMTAAYQDAMTYYAISQLDDDNAVDMLSGASDASERYQEISATTSDLLEEIEAEMIE